MINLNLYKVFYEVVISGSFSKAAKNMYLTQPGVSKSIKLLEDELNTKLFFRQSNKITLTEQGKMLFDYVNSACNSLITGEKALIESNNLSFGTITIGSPSYITSFYLLKFIEEFRKTYPGILIKIVSLSTNEMLNELFKNKIDFIVDTSPIIDSSNLNYPKLTIKLIDSFENCFICNKDFNCSIETIYDISKYPLILPTSSGTARKNLEYLFKNYNLKILPAMEVETTELIITSVRRNIGIGYVVKETVKNELNKEILKEIQLDLNLPMFDIKLIYMNEYLTSIPKKFIKEYLIK